MLPVLMSQDLTNVNVIRDTSEMVEIHVCVHVLKTVFMENVVRDLITNVFVIWDTPGLIAIQIVVVMEIRLVIHSDPDIATTVGKTLRANFATFAPREVLGTQPQLKVHTHYAPEAFKM